MNGCTHDSFCTRCEGRGYILRDGRRVSCISCNGTGNFTPERDRRWRW